MNWTLYCGEARAVLETLPAASVNCVVTSPPYWGLRDYGPGRWDGGDAGCEHRVGGQVQDNKAPGAITTGQRPGVDASRCKRCGATRIDEQIGLESSPEAFVAALVGVFREARRVLRQDGTCWLNLGDSYQNAKGQAGGFDPKQPARRHGLRPMDVSIEGLKPKDLVGIPWRVAFALQADGWYLRSDIIWAKPNPMPESVTDRPTKAHEYVFLLTKAARYAYNAEAIREPVTQAMLDQIRQGYDGEGCKDYEAAGVQNPSSVKARIVAGQRRKVQQHKGWNEDRKDGGLSDIAERGFGANARTVWNIPTEASPYEHFAVMPKALARKCILAGCPQEGTVLDPFAGVATTGVVALEEGRNFVGIELNPKYHALARARLADVAPLLAQEVAV